MFSFLQIVSTSTTGGQVINYSARFSLSSMTGTLPATVIAAINALPAGTTTGPATSNSGLTDPATPADGAAAGTYSNSYVVPYTMQTGPIRYAPMQPVPGTQITAQSASMAYPTSSVSVATTYLPPATQWQTTMTQSQTFSVASIENTVSSLMVLVGVAETDEILSGRAGARAFAFLGSDEEVAG